jgi:hypothetical protein
MVVYGIIALMGVRIWMDAKVDFTRHKNLAVAGASLTPSFRVLSWTAQLTEKPRSRKVPFSVHRAQGNPQHLRGLFGGETGKEPELHKPALAVIQLSQRHERFIESHDIRAAISLIVCRSERNQNRRTAALLPFPAERMVHQYAAHHFRRNRVEMSTVLPSHSIPFNQAKVSFVDQIRRLQREAGFLSI